MAKYSRSFKIFYSLKLLSIRWTFNLSYRQFLKSLPNYSFGSNNWEPTKLYIISYQNAFCSLILPIDGLLKLISFNFYVRIRLQLFYQKAILLLENFASNFKFTRDQTTLNRIMVHLKEFKYFFIFRVCGLQLLPLGKALHVHKIWSLK
jgi:hypothetical protein